VIRRILFFVLLACAAGSSLPRLVTLLREARELRPLHDKLRRDRTLGPFYASVKNLGGHEPLALIAPDANDDAAIFANYYLYPRRTTIFRGIDDYRANTGNPKRPASIVRAGATLERTTYAALRDEALRGQPRLAPKLQLSPPLQRFMLPVAVSTDGPPPDRYLTEGAIANGGAPARVTLTFEPFGITKTIDFAPNERREFYDFVYQNFGVLEQGWVRAEATPPVSAAFAFVDRGRADVSPIPLITAPAQLPPERIPAGAKVWRAGDFTFASTRDANGRTHFIWP
jgi:hypothetical protein